MATKKTSDGGALRGSKLIKKAIEAGRAEAFAEPEPVAPVVLKKMTLPNGEPISAAMKELLKVDALWLGIEFDEDEGDIESVSLEELLEDHFGEDELSQFAEATELFGGDCIPIGGSSESLRFLYVGEADESGEYPVITVTKEPKRWIGGFAPFDVWVAQELGVLPAAATPGEVPPGYAEAAKALADANGDGRLGFEPVAGEGRADDEDDEDEDEDDEDDDDDADGDDAEGEEPEGTH